MKAFHCKLSLILLSTRNLTRALCRTYPTTYVAYTSAFREYVLSSSIQTSSVLLYPTPTDWSSLIYPINAIQTPSIPPPALINYLNNQPQFLAELGGTTIGSECDPIVGTVAPASTIATGAQVVYSSVHVLTDTPGTTSITSISVFAAAEVKTTATNSAAQSASSATASVSSATPTISAAQSASSATASVSSATPTISAAQSASSATASANSATPENTANAVTPPASSSVSQVSSAAAGSAAASNSRSSSSVAGAVTLSRSSGLVTKTSSTSSSGGEAPSGQQQVSTAGGHGNVDVRFFKVETWLAGAMGAGLALL